MDVQSKYHGRVITIHEYLRLDLLRETFLDAKEIAETNRAINNGEPILFMPSHIIERNIWKAGVYGDTSYRIILIGILKDGRKATCVLEGIHPFFEVLVPKKDRKTALAAIQKEFRTQNHFPVNITEQDAKPLIGYQSEYESCFRFYYKTTKDRLKGLDVISKLPYKTYTDQPYNYYQVPCRQYDFSTSKWCILTNYQLTNSYDKHVTGIVFALSVNHMKKSTDETSIELMRDKTLSIAWDIETFSPQANLPNPDNKEDRMFMLAATINWTTYMRPLLCIVFSEFQTNPHPDFLTVVCGDEIGIFRGFIALAHSLKPEFIYGFNDSDYDWRWLIRRAYMFDSDKSLGTNLLLDMAYAFDYTGDGMKYPAWTKEHVVERLYKLTKVKFAPEEYIFGHALSVHGCMPLDVRTLLIVANSKKEFSSLKFFLESSNLPSKVDMPIAKLFEIYRRYDSYIEIVTNDAIVKDGHQKKSSYRAARVHAALEPTVKRGVIEGFGHASFDDLLSKYTEVAYYCMIDALSCHSLMFKNNIFSDKRSVANDSYVSLEEAFYKANGSKVQTLCMYYGERPPFNLRTSTKCAKYSTKAKYPGALVIKPKKGPIKPKLSLVERLEKQRQVYAKDPSAADYRYLKIENEYSQHLIVWYALIKHIGIYMPNVHTSQFRTYLTKEYTENKEDTRSDAEKIASACNKFIEFVLHELTENRFHDSYIERVREIATQFTVGDAQELLDQTGFTCSKIIGVICSDIFFEFLIDLTGMPTIALDFASLYPSIMMAKNVSPEKCILDRKVAEQLSAEGKNIIMSQFIYENQLKVYWFIQHNNHCDAKDPEFGMGVFPYVLKGLFDTRQVLKKELGVIEKMIIKCKENKETDKLDDLEFRYNYINAKQNSVKVFMNTFYGECGRQGSPFFLLGAAGSVTAFGRKSLETAFRYVRSIGCFVIYGDTDSLYMNVPAKYFLEIDIKYYTGDMSKIDYMTKAVLITQDEGLKIQDEINAIFQRENNNTFLKMAYEEILYPTYLLSKKKYFGVPHVPHKYAVTFDVQPSNYLVRGIDVRRRGISKFQKSILNECLLTFMSPGNLKEPIEILYDLLDDIFLRTISPENFAQSDAYRKEKKNVKVHCYRERMMERGIEIKPIERFWYVVCVRNPYNYGPTGKTGRLKIGELMEPLDEVLRGEHVVDIVHYVKKLLTSFARFIIYMPIFSGEDNEVSAAVSEENDNKRLIIGDENSKKADELACKKARKHLETKIAKYNTKYSSLGRVYQHAFKEISTDFVRKIKAGGDMLSRFLTKEQKITKLEDAIAQRASEVAATVDAEYGKKVFTAVMHKRTKEDKKALFASMRKIYYGRDENSVRANIIAEHKIKKEKLRQEIVSVQQRITSLAKKYDMDVYTLSNKIKSHINIPEEMLKPTNNSRRIAPQEINMSNLPSVKEDAEKLYEELVTSDEYTSVSVQLFNLTAQYISNEKIFRETESIIAYMKTMHDKQMHIRDSTIDSLRGDLIQIKDSYKDTPLPFEILP